ncbi:solute carrier family 22 member 21-like [Antennarius striatus]|uniref:solute carrier family 22 member 21-like n=1 Tax=Antennarius striatus TaxID=241820 RepID=UPI0035B0D602
MATAKTEDFEDCTAFLGYFGFFQILIIVMLSVTGIPTGYMPMLVVFVSDTPEHHCKEWINSTHNSSSIGPDSCSRYKGDDSWKETEELSNDTEQCLDGWVYSTDRYTSTIVSEWDLVCENAWKVPFSTSLYFVGVLIGCLICGHLSDRWGRKPVLFSILFLQAVTPLIQAASVSWIMFCILNCLRGLGQSSQNIVSLTLGTEILRKSARVTFSSLGLSGGFGIGYALLPAFAYFIRGWRMLLVASAIPPLVLLLFWWVIPESPRWLLQKGRVEEAELIIRKAAKMNRVPAPDVIFRTGESLELMQNKHEEKQKYTYMDLIRTTNMRNMTILSSIIWISGVMVYTGLSLNTSNLDGNPYLNCFFSAAIDLVGYVFIWLVINRAPRPTLLCITMMLSGIMLLVTLLVPEDMHVMFLVFALMGKMGSTAAYSFAWVFSAELMPTVVRNMGLGFSSTASRISIVICPYIVYIGIYSKMLPYIIFGTFSIVGAAVSMLLPDTRNSKLPDLISEARPIRRYCCLKEDQQTTQMQLQAENI